MAAGAERAKQRLKKWDRGEEISNGEKGGAGDEEGDDGYPGGTFFVGVGGSKIAGFSSGLGPFGSGKKIGFQGSAGGSLFGSGVSGPIFGGTVGGRGGGASDVGQVG